MEPAKPLTHLAKQRQLRMPIHATQYKIPAFPINEFEDKHVSEMGQRS